MPDLGWWYFTEEGNQVTLGYDLEKVRTLDVGANPMVMFQIQIDRGENLQPIVFKNQAPPINYMKNF